MIRIYDGLIVGLAILGALSLVFITGAIIVDVVLRNVGFVPMQWTSAVVEYVMLFATMSAAPWLVRVNGHVAITSFVGMLPTRARHLVAQAGVVLSIMVLGLLSWRSAVLCLEMIETRSVDVRSVNLPGWMLYAMLATGFGLMALEFCRLLVRGEAYTGMSGAH